jgi:hypothetical protein
MSQNRDFVLGSIVNMAGIAWEEGKPYNESEILQQIIYLTNFIKNNLISNQ